MILLRKIPFSYEEKNYEIRILYDDTLINVVAFYNNHPVNGFRHQIKFSKKSPVEKLLDHEVINELIDMSKNDICENRWERLLK